MGDIINSPFPHHLLIDPPRSVDPSATVVSTKSYNPTDQKVAWIAKGKMWAKASILAPFAFVATVISVVPILIVKLIDRIFNREKLRTDLKANFSKELLAHLRKVPYSVKAERSPALIEFNQKTKRLSRELHQYNIDSLREKLVELANDETYVKYKDCNDSTIPGPVRYLQDLAVALESMDGTGVFAKYGASRLGEKKSDGLKGFGNDLCETQKEMSNTRNGWMNKGVWAVKNIVKSVLGLWSHLSPLDFNPYRNQPVFEVPLKRGERSIGLKFSPSLTGPQSLVEKLLLPAYKRNGQRWVHVDFQSTHKGSERTRINEIHRWSQENLEVLFHAVLSSNTPEAVMKKESPGLVSTAQYKKHVCGETWGFVRNFDTNRGIYIPEKLLSDEELGRAFGAAETIVGSIVNPDLHLIDQIVKGALFWAIMDKERREHSSSTLSAGCKETIDRGPFMNLLLFVFDELAQGRTDIDPAERKLWTGLTLGKGDFAMNRGPEMKRPRGFHKVVQVLNAKATKVREALRGIFETPEQRSPRSPDSTVLGFPSSSGASASVSTASSSLLDA